MATASILRRSPGCKLDVPTLIACVESHQELSLQAIANRIHVSESTVCRWRTGEIRPTDSHRRALVALHDRVVCGHSRFDYICDHPALNADAAHGYDDPPLGALIAPEALNGVQVAVEVQSPSPIGVVFITARIDLPENLRSRSYRWVREGPPVFLILHRPGDEEAITREVIDHLVERVASRGPSLPVYSEVGAVRLPRLPALAPKAKPNKRIRSGRGRVRNARRR
jgi:hypothetical protein